MSRFAASQLSGEEAVATPTAFAQLPPGSAEVMGLPEWLERTLSTTTPMEDLNSTIRRVTHHVKRWRDGEMGRRRVGAAIREATRGFRRVRGYRGMSRLLAALRRGPERNYPH